MPGNPALGAGAFGLDASNLLVRDPNGVSSEQIIDSGDPFDIEVTVDFDGQLADWILGFVGTFDVQYKYTDDNGGAGVLGTATVTATAGKQTYSGADTKVSVAPGLPAGLYRVHAVADFGSNPVSAFANGLEVLVR